MSKKILKKTIILLTIILMIVTLIASKNEAHLDHCDDEDCEICSIIHNAQAIIRNAFISIISVINILIILNICTKMYKPRVEIISNSLIFQKVQFNE